MANVLAEATHLRLMGQADGANAWLQVVSGETVPGMPSVVRTRRKGHGSTHRLAVVIEPVDARANATPRAIAEPALAALVAARLTNFNAATVSVVIADEVGIGQKTKSVRLKDLGLEPIDLLIGGLNEVALRAKHHVVSNWSADLGTLDETNLAEYLNQKRRDREYHTDD